MLYIETNGEIRLTRGDTARLSISIANELTEEEYIMAEDDTLTFTVKKRAKDPEYIIQKVSTGSNSFHLEPSDTKELNFGSYIYDVQLNKSNGDVYTVVEPTAFQILQEVTW